MHDIIDHIERELKAKHHIETVIHTDPVVNDERTNALREQVEAAAKALDPALSIHDLRITAGPYHTNVLFDVMVPYGFRLTDAQVTRELRAGGGGAVGEVFRGDPGGTTPMWSGGRTSDGGYLQIIHPKRGDPVYNRGEDPGGRGRMRPPGPPMKKWRVSPCPRRCLL